MAVGIPFSVRVRGDAPAAARRMVTDTRSQALYARIGRAGERLLKRHFRAKDRIPNKRGFPRSHFWNRRIANSTAFVGATSTGARVIVADPAFNAKVFGATIRPKEAEALAIPVHPLAYGHPPKAKLIKGLFLVKTATGAMLASRVLQNSKAGKIGQHLQFFYRLLKSTTVPRDPTALPDQETIDRMLATETNAHMRRHFRR